jgi:hypothetical protein
MTDQQRLSKYGGVEHSARITHTLIYPLPFGRTLGIEGKSTGEPDTVPVLIAQMADWEWRAPLTMLPNNRWRALLAPLRGLDPLNSELRAALEVTARRLGSADDHHLAEVEAGWLVRLPLLHQVALLVAILKVLDEVSKLFATFTGEDVSPEVRAATQTLFAIVAVLLMIMELRSSTDAQHDLPD